MIVGTPRRKAVQPDCGETANAMLQAIDSEASVDSRVNERGEETSLATQSAKNLKPRVECVIK
eukprot:6395581-Pyramimonas_sp.AAC.1